MIIHPKTIDPGWAGRWTRQSVDLFRRAPGLAIGVMALFGLVNACIPRLIALNVPITVFMVGLLFSSLRAVDHDSGKPWTATWTFFRQTAHDLAHLARDVFLIMLVFGMAMALLFYFYSAATHGAGIAKPDPAYLHLPGWLRHGVPREGNMLTLGIFLPAVLPMIFLTMSVGHQPLMHYATGYKATVLNMQLTYTVFMGGLLACAFLTPLLRQLPLQGVSLFLAGCALMAGFAAAFWWFGAWGYLWCREMFEGTKENTPKTARQRSKALMVSSYWRRNMVYEKEERKASRADKLSALVVLLAEIALMLFVSFLVLLACSLPGWLIVHYVFGYSLSWAKAHFGELLVVGMFGGGPLLLVLLLAWVVMREEYRRILRHRRKW